MLLKVAPVTALSPGSVLEVDGPDARYAVCNLNGELLCLDGTCPHAGGPLGQGNIQDGKVVCPWHGWEFDCHTGANDLDPDLKQQTFPVVVNDGQIFIDVP